MAKKVTKGAKKAISTYRDYKITQMQQNYKNKKKKVEPKPKKRDNK